MVIRIELAEFDGLMGQESSSKQGVSDNGDLELHAGVECVL